MKMIDNKKVLEVHNNNLKVNCLILNECLPFEIQNLRIENSGTFANFMYKQKQFYDVDI